MKISIDFDITPEELRQFLGLPNLEGLQADMLEMARKQVTESGHTAFNDFITGAVQPMLAYQQWVQQMMLGKAADDESEQTGKKAT